MNPTPFCEDWEFRPVLNEDGTWDAKYADGYGTLLGYKTKELVEAWIDGYSCGASENM